MARHGTTWNDWNDWHGRGTTGTTVKRLLRLERQATPLFLSFSLCFSPPFFSAFVARNSKVWLKEGKLT